MPRMSSAKARRPRPRKGHCDRRKLTTPKDRLAAATVPPILSDDGRLLVIPTRAGLTLLDPRAEAADYAATDVRLPAPPRHIAIAPDNAVFALCTDEGKFTIFRLRGAEPHPVLTLDLPVRDLTATRKSLVVSTAAKGLDPASLLVFTRDTGKIRTRETVARPPRLRRGDRDEVLTTEPGTGTLRRIDTSRAPMNCDPSDGQTPRVPQAPEPERPDGKPGHGCCCCGGKDRTPTPNGDPDPVPPRLP